MCIRDSVVLSALAFSACSDTETYADQKKKERSAINRYIANQKIKVITEVAVHVYRVLNVESVERYGGLADRTRKLIQMCIRDSNGTARL